MLELRQTHPLVQMQWWGSARGSTMVRATTVAQVNGETAEEGSGEFLDARNVLLVARRCDQVRCETPWSSEATNSEKSAAATIGLMGRRRSGELRATPKGW